MKEGYTPGEKFEGWMSPLAPVNLPAKARALAGIPSVKPYTDFMTFSEDITISNKPATSYAFFHPPKGLAKKLDWSSYGRVQGNRFALHRSPSLEANPMARVFAILFGGYDSNLSCLQQSSIHFTQHKPTFHPFPHSFIYFDENNEIVQINGEFLDHRWYGGTY